MRGALSLSRPGWTRRGYSFNGVVKMATIRAHSGDVRRESYRDALSLSLSPPFSFHRSSFLLTSRQFCFLFLVRKITGPLRLSRRRRRRRYRQKKILCVAKARFTCRDRKTKKKIEGRKRERKGDRVIERLSLHNILRKSEDESLITTAIILRSTLFNI